jgi:hypothetical protein
VRALALAALLVGCPQPGPDWVDDAGQAIARTRAASGDTFLKIKEGLARSLFEALGEDACVDAGCRKRVGEHLICSTANTVDPYVCELRVVDGAFVAPRANGELYHSMDANRRYGTARLDGDRLAVDGDAGDELADALGVDRVEWVVDVTAGAVLGPGGDSS